MSWYYYVMDAGTNIIRLWMVDFHFLLACVRYPETKIEMSCLII